MSGNHEISVLHIGEFNFPISWEEWLALVQAQLNLTLRREVVKELTGGLSQFQAYDFVRLDRGWAKEAYSLFKASSPLVTQVQYIDFIYRKNGIFWPHLLHKDAIHSVVLERHPYLNIKGAGLIVGVSPESILAAFVLAELGIKQITFVIEDASERESILKFLQQVLFEVRFEVIGTDKVILLPGVYSVIVCYEDLSSKPDLVTALLYFNYLERGGLVINAGVSLEKIPLMEEATAIGAKVVDLAVVQVHEELMALRKIRPLGQIQQNKLLQAMGLLTKK